MTTFRDIFKKSFLESFSTAQVDLSQVVLCFVVAALLGAYLFFLYQHITRKTFYDKYFNMSLPVLAVIVCAVVLTIQFNIVVSLGMVGALSIVRFRTAVKDPMDLAFLFWTISVGIICGAGLNEVALEASALITVVMLALHYVPHAKPALLLLVNGTDPSIQKDLEQIINVNTASYKIKSRNVGKASIDLIVEVKTIDEAALINSILTLPTIEKANLLTHDGEITY